MGAPVQDTRIDPQWGGHRQVPAQIPPGTRRTPSREDRQAAKADLQPYPYNRSQPSALTTRYWRGPSPDWPVGYAPIDYGAAPKQIPRLWRDSNRLWDGLRQHAFTQQYYTAQIFHLRPSYPTRGIRSVSLLFSNAGRASEVQRVPALFVPSAIG